jgi:ubiquitin-protein ligase
MSTTQPITAMSQATTKRLVGEMKTLNKEKLDYAQAIQDVKDPFTFYFLLVGDKGSSYEGGYYIGKIMLPSDYPEKPGAYMMLTPNGRFMHGHKICLTNSDYHKESWTPAWTIKLMLMGFYSIFIVDVDHGISHIRDTPENRQRMARESIQYNLTNHYDIFTQFDQFINEQGIPYTTEEIAKRKAEKAQRKKEKKEKKALKKDAKKSKNDKVIEVVGYDSDDSNKEESIVLVQPIQPIQPIKPTQPAEVKSNTVVKKIRPKPENNKSTPISVANMKKSNNLIVNALEKIKLMSIDTYDNTPFITIKNIYKPLIK